MPLNATSWYNCVTFDITGDLIFGMPFGALAGNANHPWLQFILGSLKSMSPLGALSYVGLHWVAQVLWKMLGAEVFRKSMESVDLMLKERLKMPVDRNDLFVGLVQRQEKLVSALVFLPFRLSFVVFPVAFRPHGIRQGHQPYPSEDFPFRVDDVHRGGAKVAQPTATRQHNVPPAPFPPFANQQHKANHELPIRVSALRNFPQMPGFLCCESSRTLALSDITYLILTYVKTVPDRKQQQLPSRA